MHYMIVCAINSLLAHNNWATVAWLCYDVLADGFWPAATLTANFFNRAHAWFPEIVFYEKCMCMVALMGPPL